MNVYTRTAQESTCYRSPAGEITTDPPYNIISYTWGRFQVPEDTSVSPLQVNGIDWNIPAIDSKQPFSVEVFRNLLLRVVGCNEFVWVDVACIDQRKDRKEDKEEIGNQVGIFYRAQFGYIWLHQLSEKQLQEEINVVLRAKEANNATAKDMAYIKAMCKDPWFSSLWTYKRRTLGSLRYSCQKQELLYLPLPVHLLLSNGYLKLASILGLTLAATSSMLFALLVWTEFLQGIRSCY
jgi:hypothetical protein